MPTPVPPTLLRVRLTSRSSTTPDFEALGVSGTFRGHDGQRKMIATLNEARERWEMLPAIVLDPGDRALVLGTVRLPGNVSGLELEREFAQLMTLPGALIAHEQFFFGWDQGLRAAGLDPDAIALLSPTQVSQQASSTR